jgi:spore germination protein GerM
MLRNSSKNEVVKILVAGLVAFVALGGMVLIGKTLELGYIPAPSPRVTKSDLGADRAKALLGADQELSTVKVYFGNSNLNKDMADCGLVYPVDRQVAKTQAVARAALTELLSGPTQPEKNGGYSTSLNAGVKINSLTIANGVARVDFDEKMDEGMGGSCRVEAIRSQIEKTLLQFPSVKSVVVSVEGNSAEALQP